MEKEKNEIVKPVVDECGPVEDPISNPVVDAPVEDPTLATTDEVIPAPVDGVIPEEPAPVVPEVPVNEPTCDAECEPVGEPVCCDDECCADKCNDTNCCPQITPAQFFGTLQESVTIAWRFHLKTRKHHIHVTLNEFYDKALDIVDDIIEQYQGINGIIEEPFVNCVIGDGKCECEYLTELKAFIEKNKYTVIGVHTEISSTIDEFLALIDSTNYKLTSFCEHAVKSFDEFCYEDLNEGCGCDKGDKPEEEIESGESCGEEEEEE